MKVGIKRKKTRTTCAVRSGTLYSGPLPMNISTDFVKKKKKTFNENCGVCIAVKISPQ